MRRINFQTPGNQLQTSLPPWEGRSRATALSSAPSCQAAAELLPLRPRTNLGCSQGTSSLVCAKQDCCKKPLLGNHKGLADSTQQLRGRKKGFSANPAKLLHSGLSTQLRVPWPCRACLTITAPCLVLGEPWGVKVKHGRLPSTHRFTHTCNGCFLHTPQNAPLRLQACRAGCEDRERQLGASCRRGSISLGSVAAELAWHCT